MEDKFTKEELLIALTELIEENPHLLEMVPHFVGLSDPDKRNKINTLQSVEQIVFAATKEPKEKLSKVINKANDELEEILSIYLEIHMFLTKDIVYYNKNIFLRELRDKYSYKDLSMYSYSEFRSYLDKIPDKVYRREKDYSNSEKYEITNKLSIYKTKSTVDMYAREYYDYDEDNHSRRTIRNYSGIIKDRKDLSFLDNLNEVNLFFQGKFIYCYWYNKIVDLALLETAFENQNVEEHLDKLVIKVEELSSLLSDYYSLLNLLKRVDDIPNQLEAKLIKLKQQKKGERYLQGILDLTQPNQSSVELQGLKEDCARTITRMLNLKPNLEITVLGNPSNLELV